MHWMSSCDHTLLRCGAFSVANLLNVGQESPLIEGRVLALLLHWPLHSNLLVPPILQLTGFLSIATTFQ